MFTKIIVCFALLASVLGEHAFPYTSIATNCMKELDIKEETIRKLVPEKETIPMEDETVLKFFECTFRDFLDDKKELVANDDFRKYVIDAFKIRMKSFTMELVKLVADDCIDHCKNIKGDTKGIVGVKIMNCLKDRFHVYIEV
ncbi:hypothetical protein RN001_004005 [Aquatica leii]|uniref:Uncharacterized protein n=1 Tax=Aquatica leii TaxID=1421715 RepID=A0AAN7Q6V6_9COLE|nr:hypothetical protein RN001_004005 [Aquatica leii]